MFTFTHPPQKPHIMQQQNAYNGLFIMNKISKNTLYLDY